MDVIGVVVGSNLTSAAGLSVGVHVWDNGAQVATPGLIPITQETTYYASVKVYTNEMGNMAIYSDSTREVLVGQFCFPIPRTVNALTFLQHSAISWAGASRNTTAWVDNMNIYRRTEADCCQLSIDGPRVICQDKSQTPADYTISTTGTNPQVSVNHSDVIFSQNGGTFTVTDWGAVTTAPKEVTITVTAFCGCEEITTSITVYVFPSHGDPAFIISTTAGTPNILAMSGTSNAGTAETIHTWELFNSNAAGAAVSSARNPFVTVGTTSVYDVNVTTPSVLPSANFYLLRHTMSFPSGLCTSEVSERLFFPGSQMGVIDLGAPGTYTEEEINKLIGADETVQVSPNPATEKVVVKCAAGMTSLVLTDANGRTIETINKPTLEASFDLSGLQKGTYFIRVTTDEGTQLERVIKQ